MPRPSDIELNNEINQKKNQLLPLSPWGRRQQSATCFHFVLALIVTMFFLRNTDSFCVHTLFNRLLSGQVRCQRTLCTTSWYMEAQCERSLEQRAPIHVHALVLLPDRGAYCALVQL